MHEKSNEILQMKSIDPIRVKLCGQVIIVSNWSILFKISSHLSGNPEKEEASENEVLKSWNQIEEHQVVGEADIEEVVEEEEEEPRSDDTQNEFVIDESEVKSENEEHYEDHNGVQEVKMDFDEPEPKVVTPLRIKTLGLKISASEDAD